MMVKYANITELLEKKIHKKYESAFENILTSLHRELSLDLFDPTWESVSHSSPESLSVEPTLFNFNFNKRETTFRGGESETFSCFRMPLEDEDA